MLDSGGGIRALLCGGLRGVTLYVLSIPSAKGDHERGKKHVKTKETPLVY
jgi:hypothetical protein